MLNRCLFPGSRHRHDGYARVCGRVAGGVVEMTRQLFVKVNLHEGRYGYEPATAAEIDLAAGVAELLQQRDRLLEAADALFTHYPVDLSHYLAKLSDVASGIEDAIDACEPEVTKCQ